MKALFLLSSLICSWAYFFSLHLAETFDRQFMFMQHYLPRSGAGMEELYPPGHTMIQHDQAEFIPWEKFRKR